MADKQSLINALNDAIQTDKIALTKEMLDDLTQPLFGMPLLHRAINLELVDVANLFLDNDADPS